MFLPTTLQGADEIVQTINDLKNKSPSDSVEVDLISTTDVITDEQKPGTNINI